MTRDAMLDADDTARTLRTAAEREAIGAAAVYAIRHVLGARPEEAFVERLPDARRDVCHRLVRGVLRGKPDGVPPHALLPARDPTLPDDAPDHLREMGAAELRRRIEPLPEPCRYVAVLPFPASDAILAAPVKAVHGYDRFHLVGPVSLVAPAGTVGGPHPVTVVELLEREGAFPTDEQADRIADEVAESVANLALARLASPADGRSGSDVASARGSGIDASEVVEAVDVLDALDGLPGADPASAIERLAIEGHPFHPGAKIRRGMTPAESLLYAPEFTDEIDVRFVAVDDAYALAVGTDGTLTELLYDRFAGLEAAVERAIPADRSLEDYDTIPVHPWQYYHVLPDRYAAARRRGRVVRLPEYAWPATPLLNLRTVVPRAPDEPDAEPLPHLKLAVDVQLTNVVRTVSPQAVSNGPRVTDLLTGILEHEAFESLGILAETAATCYHPPGGPHTDGEAYDDARNLSGLARANPYSHPLVADGTVPVAVGSLLAPSPATERPIVRDVLGRFASGSDAAESDASGSDATVALAFFESYVETVVPEQLRLLCEYGVALESHPQNAVVVFDFDDGRPVATLVRDLGGIRVFDERLAYHGLEFDAYPDSDVDAHGPRDLYDKLYYALFQNHFTELIVALVEHTALDAATCWETLRATCLETFETLRSDPAVPDEWVDRDEDALFEDPTTHKALTAMRLRGNRHTYVTSRVSNPLVRSRSGDEVGTDNSS